MAFPLSPSNNQTALVNGIVYQWNSTLGVWKRNGAINSATIGQLVLNSGQTATSNVSGTLIVSGGAGITGNLYTGGIYITGSANGITFPDGTVQTTAGVAVDAFARSTANSASSNTVILQGVNTTQNTNITIATNAATAAFEQANATAGGLTTANDRITIIEGVDVGQNTRMTIIEGVDTAQNTRMSIIEGVDTTQNTNITAADVKAQAAFDSANTKFSSSGGTITGDTTVTGNLTVTGTQFYANTVNLTVVDNIITLNSNVTGAPSLNAGIEVNRGTSPNTKILWSEANTSWEFTNNGTTYEKIAGQTFANAAFAAANTNATNITILQGVDLTQNTNITNADAKAQAAFDKANDAYTLANTANTTASASGGADSFARQTANAAFTQANTATTLAQAAFDKANNTNAVLTSTVDTYTGDGSTVAYTLSVTPATINYTTAVVGGVTQPRSAYSVVGTTLTFTSAPANNQIIEVTTIGTSNTTLYTVNNIISPFLLMGA
jgi:hypothetical protein